MEVIYKLTGMWSKLCAIYEFTMARPIVVLFCQKLRTDVSGQYSRRRWRRRHHNVIAAARSVVLGELADTEGERGATASEARGQTQATWAAGATTSETGAHVTSLWYVDVTTPSRAMSKVQNSGIILAWILRVPMAHRKNLHAPFLKTLRHFIIGHKLLLNTLLFWIFGATSFKWN